MNPRIYMAWKYLKFHPLRSLILILALTALFYLPLSLNLVVRLSEDFLQSRSETTPLVLGSRGSEMDLVLEALYFRNSPAESIPYGLLDELAADGLGEAVPLHTEFSLRGNALVGTTPGYFKNRGLTLSSGSWPLVLGECVVGYRLAEKLDLKTGDRVISDPENPYDLAGLYPLEMEVVGILAPAQSIDDDSLFTDIKTVWIIEGLGHGHEDLVPRGGRSEANASLPLYNTVAADSLEDFHFHGDMSGYPVSSFLIFPDSPKEEALLLGEWNRRGYLLTEPDKVILRLTDSLFRIRDILSAVLALTLGLTGITVFFILALTVRLRRNESLTLHKIGGSARMTVTLTLWELFLLSIVALASASLLLGGTWLLRGHFLNYLIA